MSYKTGIGATYRFSAQFNKAAKFLAFDGSTLQYIGAGNSVVYPNTI